MKRLPLLMLLLTGCSMTLPVDGKLNRSNERFLGECTGYLDRTGILQVATLSGKKCEGKFQYLTAATGEGELNCDDGRKGKFIFNSNGLRGNGFGTLSDGEEFAFAFGDPLHTKDFRE